MWIIANYKEYSILNDTIWHDTIDYFNVRGKWKSLFTRKNRQQQNEKEKRKKRKKERNKT